MLDQEKDITTGTTPHQVRGRFWQYTHSGPRGHQLMTKELADTIPPLYANDGADDPDAVVARLKLFSPYNGWRWYITGGTRRPGCASASSRGSRRKRATSTWPSWQK